MLRQMIIITTVFLKVKVSHSYFLHQLPQFTDQRVCSRESAESTIRAGGMTGLGSFIDGNSGFPLAQSARTNPVVHPVSLTKDTGSCIAEGKRPRSEADHCRSSECVKLSDSTTPHALMAWDNTVLLSSQVSVFTVSLLK
jgi:hypothetical protein